MHFFRERTQSTTCAMLPKSWTLNQSIKLWCSKVWSFKVESLTLHKYQHDLRSKKAVEWTVQRRTQDEHPSHIPWARGVPCPYCFSTVPLLFFPVPLLFFPKIPTFEAGGGAMPTKVRLQGWSFVYNVEALLCTNVALHKCVSVQNCVCSELWMCRTVCPQNYECAELCAQNYRCAEFVCTEYSEL